MAAAPSIAGSLSMPVGVGCLLLLLLLLLWLLLLLLFGCLLGCLLGWLIRVAVGVDLNVDAVAVVLTSLVLALGPVAWLLEQQSAGSAWLTP